MESDGEGRRPCRRRLVVGDIHGCHAELLDLLAAAALSDDDEVIAVGDIVDRGPDSLRVTDFLASRPRATSVMGNHERKHSLFVERYRLPGPRL